jgi:hypothetical protein
MATQNVKMNLLVENAAEIFLVQIVINANRDTGEVQFKEEFVNLVNVTIK